jgi:hypothetical protein
MLVRRPAIRVFETDVNQVAASNTTGGWISGTPANLADGGTALILFDLGPEWDQYCIASLMIRSVTATSLSNITASSRDDAVAAVNPSRYLRDDTLSGGSPSILFATVTSANAGGAVRLRPAGRYLVVFVTNTATGGVQGASAKVALSLYPA